MTRILRWLLILPAAVAAWYLALLVGLALTVLIGRLCPADQSVSGACIAPWYRSATDVLVCFGAALSAVMVLFACTGLAPTHKPHVAIATFTIGTLVALYLGFTHEAHAAMVSAIVAGAIGLWWLLRRTGRRTLNS